MSGIEIIFRKSGNATGFLTVNGPRHSSKCLAFQHRSDGLPFCILEYVAEEAFELVGPIRMLASGIDLGCAEGSFARTRIKILCFALQDQLDNSDDDPVRFNKAVARLCRTHRHPKFHIERTAFFTAMQNIRQLGLQTKAMEIGGTLTITLRS